MPFSINVSYCACTGLPGIWCTSTNVNVVTIQIMTSPRTRWPASRHSVLFTYLLLLHVAELHPHPGREPQHVRVVGREVGEPAGVGELEVHVVPQLDHRQLVVAVPGELLHGLLLL